MLIIQILAILWGGIGIYLFFWNRTKNKKIAILSIIHFFAMWGIYSAIAFDYHDNVLAAMFVPWLFNYIQLEKWKAASVYFILILISKENMALWAFFIGLSLVFIYLKDKNKLRYLVSMTAISLIYFILVIKLFIPSISDVGRTYAHFNSSALGNDLGEAFRTILTKPFYSIKLLFINHLDDPTYNGIKIELFIAVILSGGLALIRKPLYIIMLIPIIAQKMYNNSYAIWGINYQYSIEFVPILTIALFQWISEIKKNKLKMILAYSSVILTLLTTAKFMDSRVSKWYSPANQRFYQKIHYVRNFRVKEVHKALKLIPDNAIVSAQTMLVPHIAFRDRIYHFPSIRDAEYIALLPVDRNTYYISYEKYYKKVQMLKHSNEWKLLFNNDELLIFKRIKSRKY
jgi:uncharacterized membrane protein